MQSGSQVSNSNGISAMRFGGEHYTSEEIRMTS